MGVVKVFGLVVVGIVVVVFVLFMDEVFL